MRAARPAWSLAALLGTASAGCLPYNPTRIFLAPNQTWAYVFEPAAHAQLATLDFSSRISTSATDYFIVSDTLPFLRDDACQPYTPTIGASGNITVVTGDCSEGVTGAKVWRFAPDPKDKHGNGTWTESGTVLQQQLESGASVTGPNYLADSISFSEQISSDSSDMNVYVFGGMCPSSDSSATTWTSSASYSNSVLTLSPQGPSAGYDIGVLANRAPPIAQAGSSLTPLPPTFSMNSSGSAETQQQDFVLLGGQTRSAFINMSQLALYSLPQQSWSYVPVQQPSTAKTDLAVRRRSSSEVTPRSGHTAVLSEDGKSIVVFGGWVGNINTPAEPQLAVLELGSGYGGSGDWAWTIPQQIGPGPGAGTGIYGHGAAMLPGGVMIVLGGYTIPAPSSKRAKRSDTFGSIFLYNTTSNSWIDEYQLDRSLTQEAHNPSGASSKKSTKIGLGAGLGIGAAILVSVVAFYFWNHWRLRRLRTSRDRSLLTHSPDGSSVGQFDQFFYHDGGIDGRGGYGAANERLQPASGHAGPNPRPVEMQHTTGMFVNAPSPTRGLRRGAVGKDFQYHPAPRYDDGRLTRGIGSIHTITEHIEEEEGEASGQYPERDGLSDAERKLREVERVLNMNDPFEDPVPNPLGSHPVSPLEANTVRRVPTVASRVAVPPRKPVPMHQGAAVNWTVSPGQDDSPPGDYGGRVSPTKTEDRTSSTLSELSQRSVASANSITRTMSSRTGAILSAMSFGNRPSNSPESPTSGTDERSHTMSTVMSGNGGGRSSPYFFVARTGSSKTTSSRREPPRSAGADTDSFMTAKTNFAQLQSEGEALLGGRPAIDRDDPYQRALAATTSSRPRLDDSQQHSVLPSVSNRPRAGWVGNIRRALNAVSISDRSFSMTSSSGHYKDELNTAASSPIKEDAHGNPLGSPSAPRRTVSDGGTLLRRKRGQKDWAAYQDDPDPGDWGEPKPTGAREDGHDEDWDVEGAASRRDVQVMFSVPKARLRVVNDDMDRASLRSASDGAVSRAGSEKKLRRDGSLAALRNRAEGADGGEVLPTLPATDDSESWKEKVKAA